MLSVNNLSHRFGNKTVLNDLTFTISPGEIVGLIGPNGSAKTTLLNILMGMLKPISGSFTFPENSSMGMSVSRKGFFNDMSVIDNINLYSRLKQSSHEAVTQVMRDLSIDYGKKRFGQLSAGMKQRVSLSIPFMSPDHLVLLDEPSNHLDIDSIIALRNLILRRKESGCAFLITSHIFSDLEKITDQILFLKGGKLVHAGKTSDLLGRYSNLEEAYLNILQSVAG